MELEIALKEKKKAKTAVIYKNIIMKISDGENPGLPMFKNPGEFGFRKFESHINIKSGFRIFKSGIFSVSKFRF